MLRSSRRCSAAERRAGTFTELCRYLDGEGVRPAAGNPDGKWTAAGVRFLLGNRTYLGEIRAGDLVNTTAHLPIVTLAEFEAAQASHGSPVTRSTEPSLLAGLLRCASCRHTLKLKRIPGMRQQGLPLPEAPRERNMPCPRHHLGLRDRAVHGGAAP